MHTILEFSRYSLTNNVERRKQSGIVLVYFIKLCGWSTKIASPIRPMRFKAETNHDLIARALSRFREFACFHFYFLHATCKINLYFNLMS